MSRHLLIGWTTVGSKAAAEKLAQGLVESGLVACVQVEGEVDSYFKWKGELCHEQESRLMVKFAAANAEAVAKYMDAEHPYEVPEWIVVQPEAVAPAYLRWAMDG